MAPGGSRPRPTGSARGGCAAAPGSLLSSMLSTSVGRAAPLQQVAALLHVSTTARKPNTCDARLSQQNSRLQGLVGARRGGPCWRRGLLRDSLALAPHGLLALRLGLLLLPPALHLHLHA
jgi:hypothetical protein